MELWGAQLFGDPCRDCGFDWSITAPLALAFIEQMPLRDRPSPCNAPATSGLPPPPGVFQGTCATLPTTLEFWPSGLQGTFRSNDREISGHDPDDLATARRYESIPLSSALWSLEISCNAWVETLKSALNQQVELRHSFRGLQRAEDIGRNHTGNGNQRQIPDSAPICHAEFEIGAEGVRQGYQQMIGDRTFRPWTTNIYSSTDRKSVIWVGMKISHHCQKFDMEGGVRRG